MLARVVADRRSTTGAAEPAITARDSAKAVVGTRRAPTSGAEHRDANAGTLRALAVVGILLTIAEVSPAATHLDYGIGTEASLDADREALAAGLTDIGTSLGVLAIVRGTLIAALRVPPDAIPLPELSDLEAAAAALDRSARGAPGFGAPPPPPSVPRITPGSLPAAEEQSVLETLRNIDAGTTPSGSLGYRWGIRFFNRLGDLPGGQGVASPYLEYRVAPPAGTSGAGPLRVVVNSQTGEMYYTWTHYGDMGDPAFVQIR